MKRSVRVVCCLWLFFGLLGVSLPAGADTPVLGQRFQLANGLIWLFSPQSDLPLVNINLTLKAGSLFEPPAKAGLAHLTATMLKLGSRKYPARQIAEELDFLGATLTTAANRDTAELRLTVLKKDLRPALEILQDILLHPTFPETELRAQITRAKASLQSDEDEPGIVAERAFRRALYGNHPYGYPVLGTPASLNRLSQRDLKEFHRRFYCPNNAILTIVGDLNLTEAEQLVREYFGSWEAGAPPPPAPAPESRITRRSFIKIDKDITQANMVLGLPGLSRSNPDFYAFQLLNYILGGGGFASRLMDNIRDNRGLAYSIHSSFEPGLVAGPFDIALETKNPSAGEALEEILRELARIRSEPVQDQELADAKAYLIGSLPLKMDSNAKRASLLGYLELYGLGLDYPWRYPEIINRLSREDLQEVARKYLDLDRLLLVVVGKQQDINLNLSPDWHELEQD